MPTTMNPLAEANIMLARAEAAHEAGRPKLTDRLLLQARTLIERALGPHDVNLAPILGAQGAVAESRGQWVAAAEFYAAGAQRVARSRSAEGIELRAELLRAWGMVLIHLAEYRRANAVLRRALAAASRLGKRHVEVGRALNGLGMVCKYTERFAEGRRYYHRALPILQAACGLNSLDVAAVHHNLGGIEHQAGRFAQALPHARRSVDISGRLLGKRHPLAVADRAAMAAILDGLGRHREAERILREALRVFERHFGRIHYEVAVTCHNLGGTCLALGKTKAAVAFYERALEIKRRLLGAHHPDTSLTEASLTTVST